MKIDEYKIRFDKYNKIRHVGVTSVDTISEVKSSKSVIVQPSSNASKSIQSIPSTPPTQNKAGSSTQIEEHTRDTTPTQVIVQSPHEEPTQIRVSDFQPVPPSRISLDTENKTPSPYSKILIIRK